MARADIAGIDLVVVEVFALEGARLVADEAVFGDALRVPFDLDFDVLGDGEQRR